MSNKEFINNLSATYADVRKLDVKKINLKGKNILEYIKENTTVILDERGIKADDTLDIWNSYVTKDVEGNVIINRGAKPFAHSYNTISSTQKTTIQSAVKVIDNKVLGADDAHLMYWQTDGVEDGFEMFYICSNLKSFSSDLSSLKSGDYMFKWCSNLTSFNGDLSSLTDGNSMFSDCHLMSFSSDLSSLTNAYGMFASCFLTSFYTNLSSLTNAEKMFHCCSNLTIFNSVLTSLTEGESMFYNCTNLTTFNSDLPKLSNGGSMFRDCSKLSSFYSDLSNLTYGSYMFQGCTNLSIFTSNLSNLSNGSYMFQDCSGLSSFSSDLSSLTDAYNMFASCSELSSFTSNLSKMTYGNYMFDGCSKLTSFASGLSSLTSGVNMFASCSLDAPSVANIIYFIPQRDAKPTNTASPGNILIGIGITNTDAAKQALAQECQCDTWADLNKEFDDKNWAVYWQFNGTASTFDLRGERPSTAVYTKLEEVFMPTEEEIAAAQEKDEHIETPRYEYTSQDGSKFYNIHWYHDSNTNNEGYDYFESLEEAISAYGVLPKA